MLCVTRREDHNSEQAVTDFGAGSPQDPTFSDYDMWADAFSARYEALTFEDVHGRLISRLPRFHAWVLDVGAGSGRDAAALASQYGHRVVAVEPSDAMRQGAIAKHLHPNIRWMRDRLPDLERVRSLGETFDLILSSAVWMHLPPEQRGAAIETLAGLLRPGGELVISFKTPHASARDMWPVDTNALVLDARNVGLELIASTEREDLLGRAHITWTVVTLRRGDDGSAALPILRNIVINDSKTATYKLALLRVLNRIALTAPGYATSSSDGLVHVPIALASLYWIKIYWQLLAHNIRQSANHKLAFQDALLDLERRGISCADLEVGKSFTGARARAIHHALTKVRDTLRRGPLQYTTYWQSEQPIFCHDNARCPRTSDSIILDRDYLIRWGMIHIPRHIWEAMRSHWVWIEPAVVNAWVEMTAALGERAGVRYDIQELHEHLEWPVDLERDTGAARARVDALGGATCVWTGKRVDRTYEIDHIVPYSVSGNNALWNLAPATSAANNAKSAKLPDAALLLESKTRLIDWWRRAYTKAPLHAQRFWREAELYIPEFRYDPALPIEESLAQLFEGVEWHVARIRRDQQISTWSPS